MNGRSQRREHFVKRRDLDLVRVVRLRLEAVDLIGAFEARDRQLAEVLLQHADPTPDEGALRSAAGRTCRSK
jgi:hypothetical protein